MLHTSFPALLPNTDDRDLFTWSGEFRDRRVEQLYRQSRFETVRKLLHFAGLAATGTFCLLVIRDYIRQEHDVFLLLLVIRCVGLAVGVAFQIWVRRARDIVTLDVVAAAGMAALSSLTFATWTISPPPALNAGTLTFSYLLVFYLLVPSPTRVMLPNTLYLTLGMAVLVGVALPFQPENLVGLALFMLAGNGLGLVGMRQFKLERRRTFLIREEARRVTDALSAARQEGRRRNEYQAWALDALQLGVILLHPDGVIHTINRRATDLLALPDGAIKPGDTYEALMRFQVQRRDFGDVEISDMRYHIDRLMRGAAGVAAARHSTTGKILEFTLSRLPDNSVAVTIADASERYALHRRLRHSVEVAGDGFAIYDANDRIAICSSRFAALYGLSAEQAVGRSFEELVQRGFERGVFSHEDSEQEIAAQVRRRIPERMIEMRTTAGEWFLVHERLTPSGDLVVVRTNITARRRMEDELRRAKEEAERALADLRGAQASLILAEKMASLGSLVAGMSHEISTPLGIGVSAASHLAEEIDRLTARFKDGQLRRSDLDDFLEASTEATRIMQGNLQRAARLIQAFKQVSADQTTDEVRSFAIGPYLREIMLSLAPALRRTPHRVQIDCPDGLVIRNRPGAIGQIVTNLVMNAIQHGFGEIPEPPPGSLPQVLGLIAVTVSQPRDGRIVIEFRDDGRGIAPEDLPRVFDPFFTTRRGTGGTGLGLHIVYNLVNQVLQGTIAVSSREGEGTRFTISFPQDAES